MYCWHWQSRAAVVSGPPVGDVGADEILLFDDCAAEAVRGLTAGVGAVVVPERAAPVTG